MDVVALIEDEILLGLPFAPRHAEHMCHSAGGAGERIANEGSPFSKLAELKRLRSKS
jgi:uncharacterized protein